ncbi:DTW domain-containing protein [Endozoicomonas sp. OPT23]|uniref:tRNA-uridine aminocarboxypropyltransferase n=1 Tax=Endozoicomonas sp. OPT23 TaxID=2072845 RepID=UPI00129C0903|nr:DTW domain-containing protein [Endozoicomonas sp. OPT23]MRI32109.1 DTW domain-containing protein [Endozoicomonas sp. OPT23]
MSRARCERCLKPLSMCYCKDLTPEKATVDLLILQHFRETKHPLNTARIAELGIENCHILAGEDFSQNATFNNLLQTKNACLLFPSEQATSWQQLTSESEQKPDLIIVLDGTWRKARKMLYLNPVLQSLPAVTLSEAAESNYRIRKASEESALSTIEATVALLREVSQDTHAHQNCLDSFERMINMQIEAMGQSTFQKNYR